jgi:hypothetical protein
VIRVAIPGAAVLLAVALFAAPPVRAASLADGYADPDRTASELRSLAGRLPGASVVEYGRSRGGRPLLALEVHRGEGDPAMRPALLVVGGCESERLATVEMALALAERAGAVPDTGGDPLTSAVLYVIPDAAPDGRARVLAGGPGWIGTPLDNDGDGRADEDGPDDLDGDGALRWMRVWRTGGAFRADTADVRASVKADAAAGRPGQFDLVREGKDDDKDERLNEDGPGGVRFDANFPHAWALFGPGAGLYPMSEPESKALADYVIARPNITAALVLSGEDNLGGSGGGAAARAGVGGRGRGGRGGGAGGGGAGSGGAAGAGASGGAGAGAAPGSGGAAKGGDSAADRAMPAGGPSGSATYDLLGKESATRVTGGFGGPPREAITSVPEADQPFYDRAGKSWQETVGIPKNGSTSGGAGSLSGWLRYQIGAFTLSAPGWALPDSAQFGSEPGTLKYLAQTGATDAFREWRAVEHPDLPGRRVETGGFDPLLGLVPPRGAVDSLGAKAGHFARSVLGWMPRLVIDRADTRSLGDGLYRVTVEIVNEGWLPTALETGVTTRKARPVRAEIVAQEGVTVVGGPPVKLIPTIAGSGGRERIEWIVKANSGTTIVARAATPRAGDARREVTLR